MTNLETRFREAYEHPEPFEATPTTFRRVMAALSIAIGIIGFVVVVAWLGAA